jgi:hypothetical protein
MLCLDACPLAMTGAVKLLPESNHPESGYNYNQNLSEFTVLRVTTRPVIFRKRFAYPVEKVSLTVAGHESENVSTGDFTVSTSSTYPT